VAIHSRKGKQAFSALPGRPWQSRGHFFTVAVMLLGSAITREAGTGHTSLFALSRVVNRAITSNVTLRPAGAD